MRIVIEWEPGISSVAKKLIRNEVEPSMVSENEMNCQYNIDAILEAFDDIIEQELEDINIDDDIKYINELKNEGVDYLEF